MPPRQPTSPEVSHFSHQTNPGGSFVQMAFVSKPHQRELMNHHVAPIPVTVIINIVIIPKLIGETLHQTLWVAQAAYRTSA